MSAPTAHFCLSIGRPSILRVLTGFAEEQEMASPSVEIPVIELSKWLNRSSDDSAEVQELAQQVARCFEQTGVLIVRDPRVSESDNNTFVDLMEKYYNQPDEVKLKDARPELHYQVGATPENTEVPRCRFDPRCEGIFAAQAPENKAHKIVGADPKWRFFWRIGDRPTQTEFAELNAPSVIPEAFAEEWPVTMNMWGSKMLNALQEVRSAFVSSSLLTCIHVRLYV